MISAECFRGVTFDVRIVAGGVEAFFRKFPEYEEERGFGILGPVELRACGWGHFTAYWMLGSDSDDSDSGSASAEY